MDNWLFLQLADSAFPVGGFAHSSGLEAAHQLGEIIGASDLDGFVRAAIWQAGYGALPFLKASYDAPVHFGRHDVLADAFLSNAVSNRASRAQGRAFITTCARVFDGHEGIRHCAEAVGKREISAHFAPTFGFVARTLGVPRKEAQRLFLHLTYRTVSAAAVRLGLVGPHEAQRSQRRHAVVLDEALDECAERGLGELAQPSPLTDLFGSFQDSFYSRLFQS